MPEYPPLTPEQQDQLDQLTYQQALADWQARETARLDELDKFSALDGVVDLDAVTAALSAVDAGISEFDTRNRIGRVRTILTLDLKALLDRLAELKTPEPEPEAPEAPE